MAITYEPIATVSLSSAQSSITFNSIPQTYTDLCLMTSTRSAAAGNFSDEVIRFNNSTSNYTNRYFYGNGSNVFSGTNAYSSQGGFVAGLSGNTATASTFGSKFIYIFNYASTSARKVYNVDNGSETNATTAFIHGLAGRWAETSAITSITLVTDSGANYMVNSTATLYGIKNTV